MNNKEEKEWIEILYVEGKVPFTYDSIINKNSNPGHDIKEFQYDRFVVVEFNIYFINFKSMMNLDSIFICNLCF